jgi:sensitive to high expression protein 9
MDNLQGNIFLASQRLNDLTGYSGIEALKTQITALEAQLAACQDSVRQTRVTYKTTIADRAASQREVTTLLARKDTWTPADLERFTALYRSDHGNEHAVQEAATKLADCERAAEQAASKLSSSILSRYHEEQIWSDKIRRMSTWGTWGLMGVNVLLFLVFQFGFEPWRRARLVKGFEDKVREALEKEKTRQDHPGGGEGLAPVVARGGKDQALLEGVVAAGIQEMEAEVVDGPNNADPAIDAVAAVIQSETNEAAERTTFQKPVPAGSIRKPETWKPVFLDQFSDRLVSLSKRDVTIIALEGAATGAAFVSLIAISMLRSN